MDIGPKNQWTDQTCQVEQTDAGNVKVVYMNCTGPDTVSYSREELRNLIKTQDAYVDALNELREWLRKHAGKADIADLHAAISSVVAKSVKV